MCLNVSPEKVFVEDWMRKRENEREMQKTILDGWDEDEDEEGCSRQNLQHFVGELSR